MINSIDQGHVGAIMLLDMSAAFDTVDHTIMLDVLSRRFGLQDEALNWLKDFLTDRSQAIQNGATESDDIALQFGVPQGSVIGPKSFIEYAEDVKGVFEKHRLHYHLFADDMQGLSSGSPSSVPVIASTLSSCFTDVSAWCAAKRLQLNASKTEVMWFGTAAGLRKLPTGSGCIHAGIEIVKPVSIVRNLGVWIDAELTMCDHISRTCQSCFYHLRRLRSIRKLLGRDVTIQLVCALVLSRLDYCNSVFAGLPATTLAPLQRVLHAAARLVNELKLSDHVTSALIDLHWLPIKQRVDYKLCCHVHNVSIGHAPAYLSDMLTACADVPSFSRLRTSSSGDYVVPRTRLKFGERAFAVSAPLIWNNLPRELKTTKCTATFKRLLKTFLFESAYFKN
jgi:hypothetical protein